MSPRTLAFIAIRLGALYFGLQAALTFSILLPGLLTSGEENRLFLIGQVAIPIALAALGVWGWYFASWLAGQVSRGCSNQQTSQPFTPPTVLTLLISGVGIWLVATELPPFVAELYRYWAITRTDAIAPLQQIIHAGLGVIVGVGLSLGASGLANLLARFREFGLAK